jgi:hypothetical protein
MRKFIYLLPISAFIACSSSETKNSTAHDSTSVDTIASAPVVEEVSLEEEGIEEDTSALEERYTAWKNLVDSTSSTLYEVTMSNRQYEATSEITWYFDADINAVYFSISWSMEGTEGSAERIAKNGRVVCSNVEENSTYSKWCKSTGGVQTSVDENSAEETKTYLGDDYAMSSLCGCSKMSLRFLHS